LSDARLELLSHWVKHELNFGAARIEAASADASFRRYFRAWLPDGSTRVVMDAPPDREDIGPYLRVARLLKGVGVHVPDVHAVDIGRGFVLLEDLGSTPFLLELRKPGRAPALYQAALDTLARIQIGGREAARELPPYDAEALRRELELMPEWFCVRHLQITLEPAERELLECTFLWLIDQALAQPTVFVHRDYHSRNLMLLPHDKIGVIDFQDALSGPVGYDLASLLNDCYIAWSRTEIESYVLAYRQGLLTRGVSDLAGSSDREFLRWFDLIGVQRHIKILGIFARLWWRDGKTSYLDDLPLTLEYLCDASARHVALRDFGLWLEQYIVPRLAMANSRARQLSI